MLPAVAFPRSVLIVFAVAACCLAMPAGAQRADVVFEPTPHELKAVLAVSGLFNLLFFVYPSPLIQAADVAAKSLF